MLIPGTRVAVRYMLASIADLSVIEISQQIDLMRRLRRAGEARRLGRVSDIDVRQLEYDGQRIRATMGGRTGNYDTWISVRPKPGHHCSCPDWQNNGTRVGPCKHVLRLGDVWEDSLIGKLEYMSDEVKQASIENHLIKAGEHRRSIALMKFLSGVARRLGVAEHVYVVGGAVRNFLIGQPIKDLDVVVDSIALGERKNSDWFATNVAQAIPVATNVTTNQYGVAIVTISESWVVDGIDMRGEVIEIANARKESYSGVGGKGKGYKPTDVVPATIQEDVFRREFTINSLLWRLVDLADGPDKAEIIDITGLGKQHLQDRLMHTPLDPDQTFSDDPTRMIRAVKFFVKYGLKISPEVEQAIRRNVAKLKDMPWEAVANILVRDILSTPKAKGALVLMDSLGIVSVLAEMIRDVKPFAAFMAGQMTMDKDVLLLLDLADLGLGDRAVSFLTLPQQKRVREVTVQMSSRDASDFLLRLKTPPVDNMALIEEFAIQPRDRGVLATLARTLMLDRPELASDPHRLTALLRRALALRSA